MPPKDGMPSAWSIYPIGIWQQRPRDDHPTDRVVAYDIETIVDTEPADGSFPPIPQHKPVAAAFLDVARDKDRNHSFKLDILVCRPGSKESFYRKVDTCLTAADAELSGIDWTQLHGNRQLATDRPAQDGDPCRLARR